MKNDLSCEVVRDLLPSYLDGVASGETKAAVERHMEECPDCRETLRRMKEPEETALTEEKEIDYLKKVRRRSSRKVAVILAIVVLLSMAAMFRLFYIGFPVDSRAIAAVVTVRDGTVRLRHAYRQRPERVPGEHHAERGRRRGGADVCCAPALRA